ncbi:MAG: S8 family serine peptidase [Flavobacteriales bacterium]|nr:S8 family serine peptidase [Flavobacteriales bacterium]MBL0034398.1 S8 family serine peptidase [Flavobacteriales bacterium]
MRPFASIIGLLLFCSVHAQTAPATYWIQFTDKVNTPYTLSAPEDYLSARAIERREAQGITIDSLDLPVDPAYIAGLLAAGQFQVHNVSRWFNAVTLTSTDTLALDTIPQLPFVKAMRMVQDGRPRKSLAADKFPAATKADVEIGGTYASVYGASLRQVSMMNAHLLHTKANARGEGMLIGILDSGFDQADSLPAFDELRGRDGIVYDEDLVAHDGDVYGDHWHGRSVLSVIVGHLPGKMLGIAPNVDVVLLRTENADSEYLVEEDNWVSGAELADSIGCDVLNTSLGYTTFDDSTQDHTWADLDGLTTRISIAQGIASRKGMIPVNSAGNSGSSDWRYISAPADAIDILAVGAVNDDRVVASFSSRGPSIDGRVKPDVSAVGWGTIGLGFDGTDIARINGTSFSGPLVAGGVTCLWQLHKDKTAHEVMDAVRRSASHFDQPNDSIGYGIPDLWRAHLLLGGEDLTGLSTPQILSVQPVPFSDHFEISLYSGPSQRLVLNLWDATGRMVWSAERGIDSEAYVRFLVTDGALLNLRSGVYVLRASLGQAELTQPVLKLE